MSDITWHSPEEVPNLGNSLTAALVVTMDDEGYEQPVRAIYVDDAYEELPVGFYKFKKGYLPGKYIPIEEIKKWAIVSDMSVPVDQEVDNHYEVYFVIEGCYTIYAASKEAAGIEFEELSTDDILNDLGGSLQPKIVAIETEEN